MAIYSYMFFIFVAHFIVSAKAFFPRTNLASGKSTLDHAVITKQGFFKPLFYFLWDNPNYLKEEHLTDFLEHVFMSEQAKALQDTIEMMSPQIKFLNALNEIVSANVEVDSFPLRSSASAHFDGEQFKQGSQRIVKLRQELITSLLRGDKVQHARNLAGIALHTLQDFYSRSNWIELGNAKPYEILGKPGSEIPGEFVAGRTEATCKSCPLDHGSGLTIGSCENNLDTLKLTSGYRSGQDIKKPKNLGKCSHGGKMDESRFEPATGGINKDSASRDESPHAGLHVLAAELAIEATSEFLIDIRRTVGDDIFAKFLNLDSERSLALVIDVSGSMSDEINDVKSISIEFVRKTLDDKLTSFTYILVPFSDPEVGPVTVTSDAHEVIDAVNSLVASGGGDCPELGMTGLYQALLHCPPETIIHYFSDADVKDEQRRDEVLSLANDKKVKINFVLSGQCSRRKKRHAQQSVVLREIHRTKRSSQGQALYQDLATQTGGQVIETSKADVADVIKVINLGRPTNSSVDLKEVQLLNVQETRTEYFNGVTHFIDIDSTLESLVLTLSAASSPALQLKMAKGNSTMLEKVLSSSNRFLVLEVTNLVNGSLKVTVSCTGPYALQVSGFSPLDFTYQLLDVEDLEQGTTRRVVGNPLRDQTLLLTMDFVGQAIREVSNLTLVALNGTDLQTFSITERRGFYSGSYFVAFIPSAERFRLKLTGIDKSGDRFQRIKPTLFTLRDVKLSTKYDNGTVVNTLFPGEILKVEINVKNSGDRQTLYFNASDDLSYVRSINPSQATLGENDTVVLQIALLAPSNAAYGMTSTVTVFASQNSDRSEVVNFMVFFVTVASKSPDLSSPTCTVTRQSGACTGTQGRPAECASATWHADVLFADSGEGLLSITTRDNVNGSLQVEGFSEGAVNTSVQANFSSNCCNLRVVFIALDVVGNTGTCSINLVPEIVSLRAKPNSTTVSLRRGDISKVPFTLRNLGSKGPFSFQVTTTSQLISYVMPFSLTLEANAHITGHVIIRSRGEAIGVQNLSVIAVSLSNNADVKQVTLFHIRVSSGRLTQPTTTSIKRVALQTNVPFSHFSIKLGETEEVNFTMKNLASAETFTLQVFSNQSAINGSVRPSSLSLKTMQNASCLLFLTSQPETAETTVTHVNVTAKPASLNTQVKELLLFSLTVTTVMKGPVKKVNLEDDNRLAVWHIVLITVFAFALVFLVTVLVVFKLLHDSWKPKHVQGNYKNDTKLAAASGRFQLKTYHNEAVCEFP